MTNINETILQNLQAELDLAIAKKSINRSAGLPTDQIEQRIAVLDAAMDIHKRMMIEDAIRENQK